MATKETGVRHLIGQYHVQLISDWLLPNR